MLKREGSPSSAKSLGDFLVPRIMVVVGGLPAAKDNNIMVK